MQGGPFHRLPVLIPTVRACSIQLDAAWSWSELDGSGLHRAQVMGVVGAQSCASPRPPTALLDGNCTTPLIHSSPRLKSCWMKFTTRSLVITFAALTGLALVLRLALSRTYFTSTPAVVTTPAFDTTPLSPAAAHLSTSFVAPPATQPSTDADMSSPAEMIKKLIADNIVMVRSSFHTPHVLGQQPRVVHSARRLTFLCPVRLYA